MKHPIFKQEHTRNFLKKVETYKGDKKKELEKTLERVKQSDKIDQKYFTGLKVQLKTALDIYLNGLNIIEVQRDDFNSIVSRQTISKLKFKDLHIPLLAGTIGFDGDYNETLHYSFSDDCFSLYKEDEKGTISFIFDFSDYTIEQEINNPFRRVHNQELIYDCLSVILYIGAYKDNKDRVKRSVIKQSKNKKHSIPQGLIHKLKVFTPLYDSKNSKGSRKNDKMFIVKGHWRNQPTKNGYKLKWIDQFWKGKQNKQMITKIYAS
jgi:hypothetical protein